MAIFRTIAAFAASALVATILASGFYTQQVLSKQAEIGAQYTPAQQLETYLANLQGLVFGSAPSFAVILSVALAVGFLVAALVKRIIRPLAPIAYPVAGAAAIFTVIYAIENLLLGGGVGAIGGARDNVGMALQALAGAAGGLVFSLLSGGGRRG